MEGLLVFSGPFDSAVNEDDSIGGNEIGLFPLAPLETELKGLLREGPVPGLRF